LLKSVDGRPIYVKGNADHPFFRPAKNRDQPHKFGACSVFSQASILDFYDPERIGGPCRVSGGKIGDELGDGELADLLEKIRATHEIDGGAGLRVVAEPTSSPTMARLREEFANRFPRARWCDYHPLSRSGGSPFASPTRTHYRLDDVDTIVCFAHDLLGGDADAANHSQANGYRRAPENGPMNRIYVVETEFSTTGGGADHRLHAKPTDVAVHAAALRDAVVSCTPTGVSILDAAADDLKKHKGHSVVTCGPSADAATAAAVFELNKALGNVGKSVFYTAVEQGAAAQSIGELAAELAADKVETLIAINGNPAYDGPAGFADAMEQAKTVIRWGVTFDETSGRSNYHLPLTHAYEQWGDGRSYDGTVTLQQPAIDPLFGSPSAIERMASLLGIEADGQSLVRETLAGRFGVADEKAWFQAVHDGFVAGTEYEPIEPTVATADPVVADGLQILFAASEHTFDGRFANNAWMQEAPGVVTKLTWDNTAMMAPSTASGLGLRSGDVAKITTDLGTIEIPVYVVPGTARDTIILPLGFGRTYAGAVGGNVAPDGGPAKGNPFDAVGVRIGGIGGNVAKELGLWDDLIEPVGVDVYPLRPADGDVYTGPVEVEKVGSGYELATTQEHYAIDEDVAKGRYVADDGLGEMRMVNRVGKLVREGTQSQFQTDEHFAEHAVHVPPLKSLWNSPLPSGVEKRESGEYTGYAWGMSIDLTKCTGCNACSIACQSENNVPVVGKDQVLMGREMSWSRLDRYYVGDMDDPAVATQPVSCVHCENAPCEQVCPVAATVHDDEGINTMVYNRCIGTRYCANNCPYKVRRFNFFYYNERYDGPNKELTGMVLNPEVTVRVRGVMEKCTYCYQRIVEKKIPAKNEGRRVRDGEIVTACQEACPSDAILFGDINDPDAAVTDAQANPRAYALLAELNVRPRTLYSARIRNPHPDLEESVPYAPLWEPHQSGHHGEGHHGEGHDGHGDGHDGHDEHGHDEHGHDAHGKSHDDGHGQDDHDDDHHGDKGHALLPIIPVGALS
ncbi:MAG: 4Fe-4S dicluster domain-containing protein, partial [Planctomycetota bacterium]